MSGFAAHDHAACVARALAAADARAERQGLRLTQIRRRVLEILLEEHRALGAYDVLSRLQAEGHAGQPPIAYRALDFLTKAGLAHRIERLNAYVACTTPDTHGEANHTPFFMICRVCETVAEVGTPNIGTGISDTAKAAGFAIDAVAIEAEGLCTACQSAGARA